MNGDCASGRHEYWEEVAERRWGRYIIERERSVILGVANGRRGHVVDVGCGGGRWSGLFAARGWSVTGLDVDAREVAAARSRVPSGDFHTVAPDTTFLPVADASASVVLCIEVLPVIESAWFLPEVRRVLEPGGRLVAIVWNRLSLRGLVADTVNRIRHGVPHPWYGRSYRSWRRELMSYDMSVEDERGLCWGPFGRASDSPLAGFAIAAERALRLDRLPSVSPWVLVTARRG